jgi:hypothetical protein
MSVDRIDDATIRLHGVCPIEDAEPLLQCLLATPRAVVDWSSCDAAHTAVIQILLVAKPSLRGPPCGGFLRDVVAPLLVHSGD